MARYGSAPQRPPATPATTTTTHGDDPIAPQHDQAGRFIQTLAGGTEAAARFGNRLQATAAQMAAAIQTLPQPGSTPYRVPTMPGPADPRPGAPAALPATPGASARVSPSPAPGTLPGAFPGQQSAFPASALVSSLQANTQALTLNTQSLMRSTALTRAVNNPLTAGPGPRPGTEARMDFGPERFMDNMESVFSRGKASILSLVGTANPAMFSTFQTSVKMLALEVGTVFTPYVEYAARGLQTAANWFRNLDDGTRAWVGRIGMGTVAVAGLATGFRTLYPLLGLASSGLRMVSIAATSLAGPWGPIIAGATALAGGLGLLAANWDKVSTTAGRAMSAMGNIGQLGQFGAGIVQPEKKEILADVLAELPPQMRKAIFEASGADKRREQVERFRDDLQARITRERQGLAPASAREFEEAQKRFELLEPYHKQLNRFYTSELLRYGELADVHGEISPSSLPGGNSVQARRVEGERTRILDEIRKVAITHKINLTAEDLKPFEINNPTGSRIERFIEPTKPVFRELAGERRIVEMDRLVQTLDRVKQSLGLEANVPNPERFAQNFTIPGINSRFTDITSYLENLQTQALNVGDADAEFQKRQLELQLKEQQGTNLLLSDMSRQLKEMEQAISKLKWWR